LGDDIDDVGLRAAHLARGEEVVAMIEGRAAVITIAPK
jgi:hypothetical protein